VGRIAVTADYLGGGEDSSNSGLGGGEDSSNSGLGGGEIQVRKLTYVEVIEKSSQHRKKKSKEKTPAEAVVVAADGIPGEWSTLLVTMCDTSETRRISADRVREVPCLERRRPPR
jgi:hypothetical protein